VRLTRRQLAGSLQRPLAIPLTSKLAGASALLLLTAVLTVTFAHTRAPGPGAVVAIAAATLAASLLIHCALVTVALRPLRAIESVAERVRGGDLAARVAASPLADRDMARLGTTLNKVLDALVTDRAEMRRFAVAVLHEGEATRARIGYELHESAAQVLAALRFQIAAAAGDCADASMRERLETMRAVATEALEVVRGVARRVHPGVVEDLGIERALRRLGETTEQGSRVQVDVIVRGDAARVPAPAATILYRVAEEALANAVRHARPRCIRCELTVDEKRCRLAVMDDGCGVDPASRSADGPATGLFASRQRVALAGGTLEVVSRAGSGSLVTATIPRHAPATAAESALAAVGGPLTEVQRFPH
jgi:signal transduction histidine kinase